MSEKSVDQGVGWPQRADCVRPGCGHSSDVHVYAGPAPLSVTDSALGFPCQSCGCITMIRSVNNYSALILDVR